MALEKSALLLLPLLVACGSPKSTAPVNDTTPIPEAAGGAAPEVTEEQLEALQALGYLDEEVTEAVEAAEESVQAKLAALQDRIAQARKRRAEITAELTELDASELIGERGDALNAELEALEVQQREMEAELTALIDGA